MKGEILATGDEIRSGALIDSNSAYIAERLEREGVEVVRHHCVGDDLGSLTDVFQEIARRADIALVTGGLGPTSDDRTTEAAARAAGVGLVLNADALTAIEMFFKRLGRTLTPSNRKQAFFPDGSEILPNPIGTAPGFKIQIETCTFFCLPGVPVEMRKMLASEVIPRLLSLSGGHRQISMVRTLSTFGATESMVGEQLSDIIADFPDIQIGYRAKFPEIQVRLYIRGMMQLKWSTILTPFPTGSPGAWETGSFRPTTGPWRQRWAICWPTARRPLPWPKVVPAA